MYKAKYEAKQQDKENLVCKVVVLDKYPSDYRKNLLKVALKVMKYIGDGTADANSSAGGSDPKHPGITKVIDIFTTDKKAYIFMEENEVKSIINSKFKKEENPDENEVKKTARELAQAIQYLHGIGVSHYNLRASSVVFNKENQLKLIGLNMCCFYWDPDMETVVPKKRLSKKDFDKNSHLPSEAFKDETFDPSLADVWAVGLLICQMIAKESPFKIESEQPFDEQWKAFAQTKQFSDEAKQLLDRIFVVDPKERPNIWDVLDDPYLKTGAGAEQKTNQKAAPKDAKDSSKDAKTEAKPDAKPEAKTDAKPEANTDAKPDANPEAKPDAKNEAKPEAKPS